jgi:hypothetical protein
MTAIRRVILLCDRCAGRYDEGWLTVHTARIYARKEGWRRDMLDRDVCPAHPKPKGSKGSR